MSEFVFNPLTGKLDYVENKAAGGHVTEYKTLIAADITAKGVTLSQTPASAGAVALWIGCGVFQQQPADYTVSGSSLDWTGGPLDIGGASELEAGDTLLIIYTT